MARAAILVLGVFVGGALISGCGSGESSDLPGPTTEVREVESASDDAIDVETTTSIVSTTTVPTTILDPTVELTTAEQARSVLSVVDSASTVGGTQQALEEALTRVVVKDLKPEDFFDETYTLAPPEIAVGNAYLMCNVADLGERCVATAEDYADWTVRCGENGGVLVEGLVDDSGWAAAGLCTFLLTDEMAQAAEDAAYQELEGRGLGSSLHPTTRDLTDDIMEQFAKTELNALDLRSSAQPYMTTVDEWGWINLNCRYGGFVPPTADFETKVSNWFDSLEEFPHPSGVSSIGVAAAIVDNVVEVLVCEMSK